MEENSIVVELNNFLADLNVFYRKLQNYHWYIVGQDFFVIHTKLEEYYDKINEQIDEIGEHILVIGGEPLATLKDYIETTTLKEAQNKKISDAEVFKNIIKDYTSLLRKVTDIKKKADAKEDYATSSKMDEFINYYSKTLWMLNQMNS